MWHTDDYSLYVEIRIAIRQRERERETRNIPQKQFPYAQLPADVSFFFLRIRYFFPRV